MFEKKELRKYALALRYIQPGDAVIDAGAFEGYYSFLYSKLVGPNGKIFAFEPQPRAFELISQEIRKRHTTNIVLSPCAVSSVPNRRISMKIYPHEANLGCTVEQSLMDAERMPGHTALIDVQTEALDQLMDSLNPHPLSLIKIDTEGHEDQVLMGAQKLLQSFRPIVIMEYGFIPNKFESNMIEIMGNMGFDCFDLTTMEQVSPGYISAHTDLVALHRGRMEEFQRFLPQLRSLPYPLLLKIFACKARLKASKMLNQ
ncbi:MAG: FkbM family methyltransferase [Chlamydiia bacterium]|nr:FkbM family methyltransferase [Chlamydiia bacterium]